MHIYAFFVSLLLNSIVPEAANSVWMRYLCSPKSYKSETEVISVEGLSVEFNATPLFSDVSYVINTRAILSGIHYEDGAAIRSAATQNNITVLTSLDTVKVLLDVLEEVTIGVSTIDAE